MAPAAGAESELARALQRRRDMAAGRRWASRIAADVWLGSGQDAQCLEQLTRHGITHVLNVADDVPNYHEEGGRIAYCNLGVADFGAETRGMRGHFEHALAFVRESGISAGLPVPEGVETQTCGAATSGAEAGGDAAAGDAAAGFPREEARSTPVLLIHCANGSNRSCTVAIALLMQLHGLALKAAYSHVKGYRKACVPLRDNRRELMAFEEHLLAEGGYPRSGGEASAPSMTEADFQG